MNEYISVSEITIIINKPQQNTTKLKPCAYLLSYNVQIHLFVHYSGGIGKLMKKSKQKNNGAMIL